MFDSNLSEHYIKRGDPSAPTYYIIRRQDQDVGLFSNFTVFAGHIRYALSKGWIPVIDMQNYPNVYLSTEQLGKINAWEYFFEQPLRVGLEHAYNAENVILCQAGYPITVPFPKDNMNFFENKDGELTEWRMLTKLGLLKVKETLLREILALREKLFSPNDRVLGVLLRGTDYVARRPHNHAIPPPIEFAASIVAEKIREWRCNKIFLATEDKGIVQALKGVFRDFCVIIDREYVDYTPGQFISLVRIDRENDRFLQGKEYLMQMIMLSTCNSLVAARCSGTVGVMVLSEKFEHTYFFNLGRYRVIGLH